jgi:hypothetical protein
MDSIFNIDKFDGLPKKKKIQIGEGIIQRIVEKLPFELHIPSYNYCGPGTKLKKRLERGDKGINRVDEVCKRHDIAYSEAQNQEDIKTADKQMLKELDEIENPTLGEKAGRFIAKTGIKTKMLLGGELQIYCLKCKKHTATTNITQRKSKKNRNMLTGLCRLCGTKKNKFVA